MDVTHERVLVPESLHLAPRAAPRQVLGLLEPWPREKLCGISNVRRMGER